MAKAKKATTARERHPGRRPKASTSVEERHKLKIDKAREAEIKAEENLVEKRRGYAEALDGAAADGVETKTISEWIGKSRQMIYKIIGERLDGKDLQGRKKKTKATTKKAETKKAAPKPKADKAKKSQTKRPKTRKRAEKTESKEKKSRTKHPKRGGINPSAFGKKKK